MKLLFLAFASVSTLLHAEDAWTQFRGPTAQGLSEAKGLPRRWSETENIRWKTPLPGEGWSSPVVANGQIWMTTALEEGKSLRALCVDFATAKHRRNSYASPTPILDGDRLYLHFGASGTACLSAKDGTKLWENRGLKVDFQNGAGGSPALFQDKLLLTCDGIDCQYEVALDTRTGKVAWKSDRSAVSKLMKRPADMRKAYGTPFIASIDGHPQSLTTGAERLYAYDPATGRELWYVDYPGFSNVPIPVTDGKVIVVATGFMKPEVWGIKAGGASGDATSSHLLWKQVAGGPAQSSPVLVNNRVYMVNDSGILSCLDATTGAIVWKERVGSDFAASLTYADGVIYLFDCMGKSLVIEPGDHYQVLSTNQLADGCMASPAIIGKSLIVRTKTSLYRIE
ncbi:MAG: PQQ-binding-like beta-propeller repeat protein [Verrucomicrobiota bacterium]